MVSINNLSLKKYLPADNFKGVLKSLIQDHILWNYVNNADFLQRFTPYAGAYLDHWTPAFIALFSINQTEIWADLKSETFYLDQDLFRKAQNALDKILSTQEIIGENEQFIIAGLSALAIREQWINSPSNIQLEILEKLADSKLAQTIYAILFGILPDQNQFLTIAFNSQKFAVQLLGINSYLIQPNSHQESANNLYPYIIKLPPLNRTHIIEFLDSKFPTLAKKLSSISANSIKENQIIQNEFEEITYLIEETEILKSMGRYDQSVDSLISLRDTTAKLQQKLAAKIAYVAMKTGDTISADKAIEFINKDRKEIVQFGDKNFLEYLQLPQNNTKDSLTILINQAQSLYQEEKISEAQDIAGKAVAKFISLPQFSLELFDTLYDLLIKLALFSKVIKLSEKAVEHYPNNADTRFSLIKAYLNIGDVLPAIDHALILISLDDVKDNQIRFVINLFIENGEWEIALSETKELLLKSVNPNIEDKLLLAKSYFGMNEFDKAKNLCLEIDNQHHDYSENHILLGNIYTKLDNTEAGREQFELAIDIDPNNANSWLGLVSIYHQTNDISKAIEVLEKSLLQIPHDPKVLLQLGIMYQEIGDLSKAIAVLNQASENVSSHSIHLKSDIDQQLGKALLSAGYKSEALSILEIAQINNPTNIEIAHLYAKALIEHQKYQKGINALEIVIQSPAPPIDAYLDYAQALVELKIQFDKAEQYTNIVLQKDPDNLTAQILSAFITAGFGKHEEAIKIYQDIFRLPQPKSKHQISMLAKGIAESSFDTGHPEIALPVLQVAIKETPDNLQIKQNLCKALIFTGLTKDASALLREIHVENNGNIDHLIWVAEQALLLEETDFAISVLEEANKVAPNNSHIILRLGRAYYQNNQIFQMSEIFQKLLSTDINHDSHTLEAAGQIFIDLEDKDNSILFLEKALEIAGYKSIELLSKLINLHLDLGNHNQALDLVRKQISLEPSNSTLWAQQANLFALLGNNDKAVDSILEAIDLSPLSAELRENAAAILSNCGKLKQAISEIDYALEIDPGNQKYLTRAVELRLRGLINQETFELADQLSGNIENPDSLLLKAEVYLQKGDDGGLQKAIHIASEIEENNLLSWSQSLLARCFENIGELDKANTAFDKALMAYNSSDNAENHNFNVIASLSEAALVLKNWGKAISLGKEAINIFPTYPQSILLLLKAYIGRAEYYHLCNLCNIQSHSPGKLALSSDVKSSVNDLLNKIIPFISLSEETKTIIGHWRQRAAFAFDERIEDNVTIKNTQDFAAYLAFLERNQLQVKIDQKWVDNLLNSRLSLLYWANYLSKYNLKASLNIADALINEAFDQPEYLAFYAKLAHKLGNTMDALQIINKALSYWPNEINWHEFAASLEISMGNNLEAIAHYDKAIAINKENPDLYLDMGKAYISEGLYEDAILTVKKAIRLNPKNQEYWIYLANAYKLAEHNDEAYEAIDKAIALSPQNIKALILAAEISIERKDNSKTSQFLEKSKAIPKKSEEDALKIVKILSTQNRFQEAIAFMDEELEKNSQQYTLRIEKANIIGKTINKKEKLKELIRLAKDRKKDSLVLANLSFAYFENDLTEEAIRSAQYAIKYNENHLSIDQLAELHYKLGEAFHHSGQLDQAVYHLSKSIEKQPNYFDAYLEIGDTYHQRREYSKAIDFYNRAVEIAPENPHVHLCVGLLYKDTKNYIEAKNHLQTASYLDPNDTFIQKQLAAVMTLAIIHHPTPINEVSK